MSDLIKRDNDPAIQSLLQFYDQDYLAKLELTEKELSNIKKYVTKMQYGSSSWMSLVCTGHEGCVYKKLCPLVDKPPLGKECPFEQMTINTWYREYVVSLQIDEGDKVERSQIMELVEADILNARANAVLGSEGFIMENPVGSDPDTGQPLYRKEEHIAMNIKEKAQLRRDKLLKTFIATREAKLKGMRDIAGEDATTYLARLKAKVVNIRDLHSIPAVELQNEEKPPEVVSPQEEQQIADQGKAENLW
jgi:hypothetical protein